MSYEFGLHLKQCGIVSQLTPPETPQRNGVSECRNCTLLDIVRSMISLTDLLLSFWGYALETVAFTLNRAPSKSVSCPDGTLLGVEGKLGNTDMLISSVVTDSV